MEMEYLDIQKEEVITYFSHADTTAFSSGLELRMADQPESPSWPAAPVLLLSPGPCCCCGGGCCGGEDKETGGCCFGVASLCCRRVGLSAEVPAAPAGHLIL